MSNIHFSNDITNGMFAPQTESYSKVRQLGYHRKYSMQLSALNDRSFGFMHLICFSLKSVDIDLLTDDVVLSCLTLDLNKILKKYDISSATYKRYISYLVSCNLLQKKSSHNLRVYIVNPVYYNNFTDAQMHYYNNHLRSMFNDIIIS